MKTLYTAHATTTGGRNGHAETSDGALKLDLASPGAANAKAGTTNPEQLFACGYAACFGGALDFIAKKQGVDVSNSTVNADVNLNQDDNGFFISAILHVKLPGMEKEKAEALVRATHDFCPYSKATRGNIEVTLKVNEQEIALAA